MTISDALDAWGSYDRDRPFALFAEVRARGPVHTVTLVDGHAAWLVVGYDEALAALRDPRFSKDMRSAFATGDGVLSEGLPGPEFARHMLAVDPPDHTRLRRLVSAAFSIRTVERLEPRVQTIVDDLLDEIAFAGQDATVDLVASFAFPLPFTVICELLGVPEAQRPPLGSGLTAMLVPTPDEASFARAKTASDGVIALLRTVVDTKRARPANDLVSGLIAARDGEERLDDEELLSTIFQLIVAGHDTTTSFIGNSIVALLGAPDQLALLQASPEKLTGAVEELLRFDSPVPHSTFRFATQSVDIGGTTVPAGSQVIICLAAANRDQSRDPTTDVLDIDRDGGRHLAFGHGIHHCLGAPLARMEGRLALDGLVRRFPHMRLAVDPADLHWGHGDGLVLRGLSELPVIPGPSQPR